MPTPLWSWCPLLGATISTMLAADENANGDGYVHARARGINTVRNTWDLGFAFTTRAELLAMDSFLEANAAAGFWFRPPAAVADMFATCDEWKSTVISRTTGGEMVGRLDATFARSFTPQGSP